MGKYCLKIDLAVQTPKNRNRPKRVIDESNRGQLMTKHSNLLLKEIPIYTGMSRFICPSGELLSWTELLTLGSMECQSKMWESKSIILAISPEKLHITTAREGNVFTGVCLSTIDLTATGSLLGLLMARSVRILLECFLVIEIKLDREGKGRGVTSPLGSANVYNWKDYVSYSRQNKR